MKDLYERLKELAEERGIGKMSLSQLAYKGNNMIVDKYGLVIEHAHKAYRGELDTDGFFEEMDRRDNLLYRYVRRYLK